MLMQNAYRLNLQQYLMSLIGLSIMCLSCRIKFHVSIKFKQFRRIPMQELLANNSRVK